MLAAIACGTANQKTETSSTTSEPADTSTSKTNGMADLKGDIHIDGSSTVFPISEAVAEEFGNGTNGDVRVTVGISGTGGGFKKFCNNETHISDASRPIKAKEVTFCGDAGVEYIELPVAIDGITVMVNPQNDFAQCMTIDELHTLWGPEAEDQVTRWSQVRAGWPDEPIRLYGPGVDSGTFDYFTETVNGESQASRADFTASEDDNVLVQGISGDRGSLGYFGYAYYAENTGRLKAVGIDGGSGCITPTEETINNGTYAPLSRPLFIYVREDAAAMPQVRAFVEYFLSEEGRTLVAETGYIPFPDEVYELALARFQKGVTGTLFGGENPQKGPVADVLSGG
jgi:phosphate transport system substrate-binding protein